MSEALPELPEPAGAISVDEGEDERTGGRIERCEDGYSAEQMQSYARKAVLLERERCAKVCEGNVIQDGEGGLVLRPHRGPLSHDGQRYAAAIRAGTTQTER